VAARIAGTLDMSVADAGTFCEEPTVATAVAGALASVAQLPASGVAGVGCVVGQRRLQADDARRRLASELAVVSYRLLLDAVALGRAEEVTSLLSSALSAEQLRTEINRQLGSGAMQVESMTVLPPTLQIRQATATTPPPSGQLPEQLPPGSQDDVEGASVGLYVLLIVGVAACVLCTFSCLAFFCWRRKNSVDGSRNPTLISNSTCSDFKVDELFMGSPKGSGSVAPSTTMGRAVSGADRRGVMPTNSNGVQLMDEAASESTLATSASALWRAGQSSRRGPLSSDSVTLDLTDDLCGDPTPRRWTKEMRSSRSRGASLDAGNGYTGHWLQRGNPHFAATIGSDTIRYKDGNEHAIRFLEDGSLELSVSDDEFRVGRLLGEELLWNNGDIWTRARSAAFSWKMADWAATAHSGGSDAASWAEATGAALDSPHDGMGGPEASAYPELDQAALFRVRERKQADRCYTC